MIDQPMPLLKTPAITLKSRKWGEADRIVIFYTLRFGKLRGVARGARRPKSQLGGACEPFVLSDLNLFQKPNDPIHRITHADIREPLTGLREDLQLMAAAGRLVNLVAALTGEGDAAPNIFDTLQAGLRAIHGAANVALLSLLFQIQLLRQAGFAPQMQHCVACGRPAKAGTATGRRFSPQSGGTVCEDCSGRPTGRCVILSPSAHALLQHATGWATSALSRFKVHDAVRDELQGAVDAYTTVVVGRPLPPADFLVAAEPTPVYQSS